MKFTTLNTIINDILSIARGSIVSQSEPISRNQIEDWIHQYRALFLRRELDKTKTPNPDYIQEIPFVELEDVPIEGDSLDSGYSGYTLSGDTIKRTTLKIPKTVNLSFSQGLTFIGTPEGKEVQYIPEHRSEWQPFKRYTASEPFAYLKDNKLHVINGESLTHLHIRGIFEIPTEVGRFVNPATSIPYYDINSPYPVPNNIIPTIKEQILSREMNIEMSSPSDTKNDGNHGLSQNVEK